MSRYKRLPTVKKKGRDEFVSAVDQVLRFLVARRRMIIPLVLALLLLGLGTLGWRLKHEKDRVSLHQALTTTLTEVHEAVKKGDYALAKGKIGEGKKMAPDRLRPLLTLSEAELLWQTGEADKALPLLESIEKGDSELLGAYPTWVRAKILLSQGKTEEGFSLLHSLSSDIQEDTIVRGMARAELLRLKLEEENR